MLWQAITPLEARELLIEMKLTDYPNMDKRDRERFHHSIHGEAYPFAERRSITWEEAAAMIGQGGTKDGG